MIYILAAVGALTVAVLLWQAFGPAVGNLTRGSSRPPRPAPDDDPEFLRKLDEQRRRDE